MRYRMCRDRGRSLSSTDLAARLFPRIPVPRTCNARLCISDSRLGGLYSSLSQKIENSVKEMGEGVERKWGRLN